MKYFYTHIFFLMHNFFLKKIKGLKIRELGFYAVNEKYLQYMYLGRLVPGIILFF